MTRYPRWKFYLLLAVLMICGLYALPNLYPDVPAVQISSSEAGGEVPPAVRERIDAVLDEADLAHDAGEAVENTWLVRMQSIETQMQARELLSNKLGDQYVVALNLAPTTPAWLQAIGAKPMNLGLDLRGGVHFLLQVDMNSLIEQRMSSWAGQAKLTLKNEGIRYRRVTVEDQVLTIRFDDQASLEQGRSELRTALPQFSIDETSGNRSELRLTLNQAAVNEMQDYAVDQNRTALSNRVNELGVAEAVIQRQGADRILVQLPGVQDTAQARRLLGRTATLEFRLVAERGSRLANTGIVPPGTERFPFRGQEGRMVLLERAKIATGDQVTNAQMSFDPQSGQPQVNVELDAAGARQMQRVTARNVGNPMAVLFIETKTEMRTVTNENGESEQVANSVTERYVINVATIQDTLGSRFRITGLDSAAEASELALLLRAGALAAPVTIVQERTVGPSLGADNIEAGLNSMIIGMLLVLVFMVVWYKLFGLFANVALLGNVVMIFGIMSIIPGATLTMPGLAGVVLTIGMAVDANVLIYERIREELRAGRRPRQAIDEGFHRAFGTILDANLTTLIVAIVLFAMGSGSVQGFAVVLFIGVLSSMFTAIVGTRALAELVYGGSRSPKTLSI